MVWISWKSAVNHTMSYSIIPHHTLSYHILNISIVHLYKHFLNFCIPFRSPFWPSWITCEWLADWMAKALGLRLSGRPTDYPPDMLCDSHIITTTPLLAHCRKKSKIKKRKKIYSSCAIFALFMHFLRRMCCTEKCNRMERALGE